MSIDEKTLDHIARLAKLELTIDQKPAYLSAFNKILDAMDSLQALDTTKVTSFGKNDLNSLNLREDTVCMSPIKNAVEANAPEMNHGYFLVPTVIGE